MLVKHVRVAHVNIHVYVHTSLIPRPTASTTDISSENTHCARARNTCKSLCLVSHGAGKHTSLGGSPSTLPARKPVTQRVSGQRYLRNSYAVFTDAV